jgi:hypothetical protein
MTATPLAIAVLLLSFGLPHEPPSRALPAGDAIDSVYTDIADSKCATIAVDEEAGGATQRCPGIAGYALLVEDDDARMSVTVVAPNGEQHPLNYWQVVTTAFSTLGPKAEWRVTQQNGEFAPLALIVRVNANESDDPGVITSYLAVAKITPQATCVTDKIAPGADMNLRARRAADSSAGRPCLEPTAN